MEFDWDENFRNFEKFYKRDGFDFKDSQYASDLYKILFFLYTYGKGYPSVDRFYDLDFQYDVTCEHYDNIAENGFCLEALRLLKEIRTIDYPYDIMEGFFCSHIIENLFDRDEPSIEEYQEIRKILLEEDLIPSLKIEDIDAEYDKNVIFDKELNNEN